MVDPATGVEEELSLLFTELETKLRLDDSFELQQLDDLVVVLWAGSLHHTRDEGFPLGLIAF